MDNLSGRRDKYWEFDELVPISYVNEIKSKKFAKFSVTYISHKLYDNRDQSNMGPHSNVYNGRIEIAVLLGIESVIFDAIYTGENGIAPMNILDNFLKNTEEYGKLEVGIMKQNNYSRHTLHMITDNVEYAIRGNGSKDFLQFLSKDTLSSLRTEKAQKNS